MNAETFIKQLVFVDTNILVYAYDRSAGHKHTVAALLMESCWRNRNGCLSLQVLQEFYVTITRKITTSIENQIASQIVADLAHWRIHSPEPNDLIQAIDLQRVFQVSFWDAMVLQSASQIGCRQLFSEDLGHYQFYNSVQVINPFTGKNEWTFSPMPSMTA